MRLGWRDDGYEWARFGCLPCWSQTYLGEELSHTLADKHGWDGHDGGGSDLTVGICVSVPSLQGRMQTQVAIGALLHQCPRPNAHADDEDNLALDHLNCVVHVLYSCLFCVLFLFVVALRATAAVCILIPVDHTLVD